MAIVGVFIDLAMQYTNSIGRNVRRSLLLRQATNIGDASTEMAFSAWQLILTIQRITGSIFTIHLLGKKRFNDFHVSLSLAILLIAKAKK